MRAGTAWEPVVRSLFCDADARFAGRMLPAVPARLDTSHSPGVQGYLAGCADNLVPGMGTVDYKLLTRRELWSGELIPVATVSSFMPLLADIAVGCGKAQGTTILLNAQSGFRALPAPAPTASLVQFVALADFDRDGRLDLLAMSRGSQPPLGISLGDGKGGFALPFSVTNETGVYTRPALADLDGDGRLDVATVDLNYASAITLYAGRRADVFAPIGYYATGAPDGALAMIADFDGDGTPDLAAASTTAGTVSVLLQRCLK